MFGLILALLNGGKTHPAFLARPAGRKFSHSAIVETTIRALRAWGTGKAQRYFAPDFASDFDRFSDRLFGANGIEAIEVAMSSGQQRGTARAHPVQQCSTG